MKNLTTSQNGLKVCAVLLLMNAGKLFAQQTTLFNTYSYDLMQLNIATIGRTCVEADLNYRAQWVGIKESPKLYQLNASMAFGESNGAGIKVFQQSQGLLKVTNLTGGYGYRIKLNETSKLHFGIGASWSQNNFDVPKTKVIDANDPTVGTQSQLRSNNFDCEAGVLFLGNKLTAGVSGLHIYNTNAKLEKVTYNQKPEMNFVLAYKFNKGQMVEIEPWLVNRYTVGGASKPEGMINVKLLRKFTVAAGYRINYGMIGMAGFELGKFRIAYSFDYGTGKSATSLGSSHQILLGIDLCKKKIKSEPDTATRVPEPVTAVTQTLAPEPEPVKEQPVAEAPAKENIKAEIIKPDVALLNPVAEENVSLEGVLKAKGNPDAFKNVKVKLLNEKGEQIGETTTNRSGAFAFRNIPANQNFMVAVDEGSASLPEGTKVTLTNLAGKEIKSVTKGKGNINYKILSTEKSLMGEVKAEDASLEMSLIGRLYDQNMKPLTNTHLKVKDGDGNERIAVTDNTGRFNFKGLAAEKNYLFSIDESDPTLQGVTFVNVAGTKDKIYRVIELAQGRFEFKMLDIDKNSMGEFKVEETEMPDTAPKPKEEPLKKQEEPVVAEPKKEPAKPTGLPKLIPNTDINPIAIKIVFGKNSYTISPENEEKLREVAKQINTHTGNVVIVGYASPEGEQHHNSDLAISRADAVKKALINNGVKASRLSVKNGGATSDLNPDLEGNRTVRFE